MRKVFSYNADINKNAYMNWRTNLHEPIHNMNTIADGYFQNAILLAKSCLQDNLDKKADVLIFPMLFSVNHAIELYEKSICWSLNILLGNKSKFKENHDIRGIWLTVKQKIKEFGFVSDEGRGEKEFYRMIQNLEKYLQEIYTTIMDNDINSAYYNIDFSRYPLNNHNEYHFYLKNCENVIIDIENFLNVIEDINDCLSRLATYYYSLIVDN